MEELSVQGLRDAWSANQPGSEQDHVIVALPSFSLGEAVVSHYGTRLPALEHRFLLSMLMLPRIPGCHLVFVSCQRPSDVVIGYYLSLMPPETRTSARSRLHLLVVEDPSPRPVAAKLLDRPDLVAGLKAHIAGRSAMLEPWNVTDDEMELADALGIPVNGTVPRLWSLGFKGAGRQLFRRVGVPLPLGQEDVCDPGAVIAACQAIASEHPDAVGAVVKLDNSGAGDGNVVLRFGADIDEGQAARELPEWYLRELTLGGVVEELLSGDEVRSPSVQVDITPHGHVQIAATHEQLLGGDNGQVYMGCRFPADPAYAAELARHGEVIGHALMKHGALGRFAVDFVVVRREGRWKTYALEINLRRGGTTHPYTVLRHLLPGRYDAPAGRWAAEDGTTRVYCSTDNLVDATWRDLDEHEVIEEVRASGAGFDSETGTGVVLHMLTGLGIDGRIGVTAIARDHPRADALIEATTQAVHRVAARSTKVS